LVVVAALVAADFFLAAFFIAIYMSSRDIYP
jgi:hypothetical protein